MSEKESTRQGYGDAMLQLGKNKQVVALIADLASSKQVSSFFKKISEKILSMWGC